MTRRAKGFTLVELLVVIGIISVLAALILPGLLGKMVEVYKVECVNQQKQIYAAMILYTNKYNGRFPWAGKNKMPWDHLQLLVETNCIKSNELFVVQSVHRYDEFAPLDTDQNFKLTESSHCSWTTYDWPVRAGDAPGTIILCNKAMGKDDGFKDGYVRTRLDGSVKWQDAKKLPDRMIKVAPTVGTDSGPGTGDPTKTGTGDDW